MDFDDLLMRTVLLLRENLDVRVKYQQRWRFVLVDEFQDTNTAQYELIRLLATGPMNNRNVFVVGDEDQSIYKFRGADYHNVQLFKSDFPEARTVLLEQNYRSTQTILDVANSVIRNNRHRTPKQLRTDNGHGLPVTVYEAYNEVEEASYVATRSKSSNAAATIPGDVAVMYRTNAQSRALEEAFVLRGMKYRLVGATRFYERKEIKDALAYLRLIHNPADSVALGRIINTPRGGSATRRRWRCALGGRVGRQPIRGAANHPSRPAERAALRIGEPLPPQAALAAHRRAHTKSAGRFFGAARRLGGQERAARYGSVAELLDAVLLQSRYAEQLRDGTDEGEDRFENLQELRAVAATIRSGCARPGAGPDAAGHVPGGRQPGERQRRPGQQRRRGHAADAAHGQGAGVSRRLPGGAGRWHPAAQPHAGKRRRGKRTWPRSAACSMSASRAPSAGSTWCTAFRRSLWGEQRLAGAQPLPG
ncbi:MAG: 3'-5' exonuclease [Microthrixaceae bacterium]